MNFNKKDKKPAAYKKYIKNLTISYERHQIFSTNKNLVDAPKGSDFSLILDTCIMHIIAGSS